MDCSLPGSSVHGISQARILEWVAISFSRGSSWPRNQTHDSYIGRWIFSFFLPLSHLGSSLKHIAKWKYQVLGAGVALIEPSVLQGHTVYVHQRHNCSIADMLLWDSEEGHILEAAWDFWVTHCLSSLAASHGWEPGGRTPLGRRCGLVPTEYHEIAVFSLPFLQETELQIN